ncbi:MAG: hypothetical protein ABSA69_01785 [Verrucomicrobiota bacterium]|jgi:hypothetical protein
MKTHIIRWVSSVSGGIGTGKKLFEKEEAEQLAVELNSSYPDIDHEAVPAVPPAELESVPPQTDGLSAARAGLAPGLLTEAGFPLPKPLAELST